MLVAVSACASGATASWTFPPAPAPSATANAVTAMAGTTDMAGMPAMDAAPVAQVSEAAPAADANPARLHLTIVTGDMIGHNEFPAFIPSDFTLPANSTVIVTITNFDDATALPKGQEAYASVEGTTDGTFRVQAINPKDPNGNKGVARTATNLNPTTGVSHTFTIKALGVNVPIAPMSRTTFTIKTGAPGTYAWHCYDPCGDGPDGWGTAMAAMQGFMEGTVTVAWAGFSHLIACEGL
jgi:hypothetical protein